MRHTQLTFVESFVGTYARDCAARLAQGVTVRLMNHCNDYEVCAAEPHARAVRVTYVPDHAEQCRALALAVEQVLGLVPMPPEKPG